MREDSQARGAAADAAQTHAALDGCEPLGAFSLSVSDADGGAARVRVTARGELDLAAADAFKRTVQAQVEARRPVLLDLAGVEFIDSTGLAAVIAVWTSARTEGVELALRSTLSPQVHRLF